MKSKQIKNLARKTAVLSFNTQGVIDAERVKKYTSQIKKLPLSQALPLLQEYLKELKKEMMNRTLSIESVVEISAAQMEHIKKAFSHTPVSQIETSHNPSLLGGVKVKIGDMVYNDSLAEKINQLKKATI